MPPYSPIQCERCGTLVKHALELPAVGSDKGARVYTCPDCQHRTWAAWQSVPVVPQQQQAQQQEQEQEQQKDDEKE